MTNKLVRARSRLLSGDAVDAELGSPNRRAAMILAMLSPACQAAPPALAASVTAFPGSIVVLGAGGQTGKLCVEQLRAALQPVTAYGRAGADEGKDTVEELAEKVRGTAAVIFACSASSKGGDAKAIDEVAAVKAAQACKLAGLPKYVLLSSGGVARPGATNWMPGPTWGIMDAKARGEEGVKAALRGAGTRYTILRPGGLEDSPALGPRAMEVNQGDIIGGLVSRADVAAAAIAAATSPETDDVTFELYAYGDAFAQKPGPTDFGLPSGPTGYERRGSSWPELFRSLRKDFSKL
eukprot:CAMPEP_0115070742 /NCGR_PEP_ID=MMETSP0227-20121206/13288_1 /TAXON_ID=89957 /ORGANISM="Polarella glacialis, Strain CCMP 1383" /LENGTH=294 /DNA_ID=CAMNT_0002457301 /DNA_START=178 /DNA_END=1065 /DNA_ORIENTATION=-